MTYNKLKDCTELEMLNLRQSDLSLSLKRVGCKNINSPTKEIERQRIPKLEAEIKFWTNKILTY